MIPTIGTDYEVTRELLIRLARHERDAERETAAAFRRRHGRGAAWWLGVATRCVIAITLGVLLGWWLGGLLP